jgi:RNA polymerase sigma factor (sigma-70 family)
MSNGVRNSGEDFAFALPQTPEEEAREDADTACLVARAQKGDSDSFATIYSRYFDRVFGYMLVVLTDQGEAEDAAQHVFVKALEALPGYKQGAQPFRAWLFRISRNHAVDQLRRLGRVIPVDPSELRETQEQLESGQEEEDYLRSVLESISDSDLSLFLERLSLPQRQVLMLRFTADFTNAEIAKILGRSAADVRMLQSRALRFLRTRLNALGRRYELSDKGGDKIQMRRLPQEAPVLRSRKWSLHK